MLSIALYLVAALLFLLAGANQTLFGQPPPDEVAWGLLFVVLATLLGGYGPEAPWRRQA